MINIILTSDRNWIPGTRAVKEDGEKVMVLVTKTGEAGLCIFSGTSRDISAAQAVQSLAKKLFGLDG